MKGSQKLFTIGLVIAVAGMLTPAVIGARATDTTDPDAAKVGNQVLRIEFWDLWQASGAELYQELCAACHGADAIGDGPAAASLKVPTPALTELQSAGIPRAHWTYALSSSCKDRQGPTALAHETMPCWRRIFRQALGNDAAPMLVNKKLVDYLASIQQ